MKRFAVLVALAAVLSVATSGWVPAGADQPGGHRAPPVRLTLASTTVKAGLAWPAGFTFLPNGRIVYGERNSGRVVLLVPSTEKTSVMYTITKVQTNGEQGLLGLAVDPEWPSKPFVYAYATRKIKGQLKNEILRIKISGTTGVSAKVIWKLDTTPGTYHDGGHIAFGPDGMLYAVVGDGHDPANSQDLTNDAGKVLRMTRHGAVPKDNPFPGSLIFTYGLRNSFGFAFDPQSGTLWETENGPTCVDEINVELPGENHGWGPSENCSGPDPNDTNQDGPLPRVLPLRWFTPTIAPTGLAFCDGCGITNADGALFFGAFNTGEIREIQLTQDRRGVSSMFMAYDALGAVLSVQAAPDGGIYFSTKDTIFHLVQS
jgi:glucose/arabinose dehydrogenase